jgi:hypothetical protein
LQAVAGDRVDKRLAVIRQFLLAHAAGTP